MKLLGLDFDNTLVQYDNLFHRLALEKGLISRTVAPDKLEIREYLRAIGRDEEFTLLQGEVYGRQIHSAEASEGMFKALMELKNQGVKMALVSHKTKRPYKGPNYDLHQSAWSWLDTNGLTNKRGLDWNEKNIFFEETKEAKIKRIIELGCTHYIDDLPEILELLPENIDRIYYCPKGNKETRFKTMTHWNELRKWI